MAVRRLFLLDYGTVCVDKGVVLTGGVDWGTIIPTPICGALIDTDDGWILVDTGMHPVHAVDYANTFRDTSLHGKIVPVMRDAQRADHQVALCGVNRTEVALVINTHLHFDHCGGNGLFPRATFIVQRDHYEWALTSDQCFPRDLAGAEGRWKLIDGEPEIVPGVQVLRTPGHVPGHQSVVVWLPQSGPVIIAADALLLWETREPDSPVTAWDADEYHRSVAKLLDVAHRLGARILPGHEQAEWVSWRRAPEYCT